MDDAIILEIEPPRRHDRFPIHSINLKAAYFSNYTSSAPTNYGTHQLYNSSKGDRVLVVRGFAIVNADTVHDIVYARKGGVSGTHVGTETPYISTTASGVGQHYWVDAAAAPANYAIVGIGATVNPSIMSLLPLLVLHPNESIQVAQIATGQTLGCSFWWEELRIDDPALGVS